MKLEGQYPPIVPTLTPVRWERDSHYHRSNLKMLLAAVIIHYSVVFSGSDADSDTS